MPRLERDGRSGPQTRDGVIPQDNRSVNPGGQLRERAAGPASAVTVARPSIASPPKPWTRPTAARRRPRESDQVRVRPAEPPGPGAPAEDRRGPVQPRISHEVITTPVDLAEQLPSPNWVKFVVERRMQIGAADQLHPRRSGKQAAEAAALEGVRESPADPPALLVKQAFAGLHVRLDPVDHPQQPRRGTARQERLPARSRTGGTRSADGPKTRSPIRSAAAMTQRSSRAAGPTREASGKGIQAHARRPLPAPCRRHRCAGPAARNRATGNQAGEVAPEEPGQAEAGQRRARMRSRRTSTTRPGTPVAISRRLDSASAMMICRRRGSTPSGMANAKSLGPLVEASQKPGSHQKALAASTTSGNQPDPQVTQEGKPPGRARSRWLRPPRSRESPGTRDRPPPPRGPRPSRP